MNGGRVRLRAASRRLLLPVVVVVVAAIAVACAPVTIIRAGQGGTSTPSFQVERGTFHIHWVAHDPQNTKHGCLFGLSIDVIRTGVADPRNLPDWGSQKLIYQSLGVGAELTGDRTNLLLPAGSYLLRSEGDCEWRAEIVEIEGGIAPQS